MEGQRKIVAQYNTLILNLNLDTFYEQIFNISTLCSTQNCRSNSWVTNTEVELLFFTKLMRKNVLMGGSSNLQID